MKPLRCLLAIVLALLAAAVSAQNSFTVTPLRVDLSAKAPAAVIDVINTSAGALTLQMQQRAWVQNEGRDAQAETRDLILSPAIFTLQPGEKQVVRIALRGAPDAQRERAYRVFVSEVPTPQIQVAPDASGFRVALRMRKTGASARMPRRPASSAGSGVSASAARLTCGRPPRILAGVSHSPRTESPPAALPADFNVCTHRRPVRRRRNAIAFRCSRRSAVSR